MRRIESTSLGQSALGTWSGGRYLHFGEAITEDRLIDLLTPRDGIDTVMTRHRLDALVAPTGSPAWLIDLVHGDRFPADESAPSTVTSVAGYPQVTVPMGMYKGLPVGISFFGRAWSEPKLIALAYAYEQATKHRRPPAFVPTVKLD